MSEYNICTLVVQVLEAVLERLQDFEDKVRSRAIIAICEAAMASPEVSPSTKLGQEVNQSWPNFASALRCTTSVVCSKHRRHAC